MTVLASKDSTAEKKITFGGTEPDDHLEFVQRCFLHSPSDKITCLLLHYAGSPLSNELKLS